MYRARAVFLILFLSLFLIGHRTWAAQPQKGLLTEGVISFEEPVVPAAVNLDGSGTVAVSKQRYIHGRQSLQWNWRSGDRLTIFQPINYVVSPKAARASCSVFQAYIYNEKPLENAKLRIEFAVDAKKPAACWFEMGLNFTGWRTAILSFKRDMQGCPVEGMEVTRVIAPNDSNGGVLYFDQIAPGVLNDMRYQWPDWNLQKIGPSNVPPTRIETLPKENLTNPDEKLQSELKLIAERLEGCLKKPCPRAELEKRLTAMEIVEDQHGIRGRHVEQDCQYSTLPSPLCVNARNSETGFVSLKNYGSLMLDFAYAYRAAGMEADRRVYRDHFNRMVRHLIDQGWTAGSSLGTTHHFGYESAQWAMAIFLMRKPLAESGLLAPMADALTWYAREFTILAHPESGCFRADDMDYLHTVAGTHLMLILMQPDVAEQAELLRRFSQNMVATLANPKHDIGSGFKIDGTAFHHGGNYPAYSFGGMNGAANLVWLLRGTRFALPADARATIKRSLIAAWIYTNPEIGLGLCGRHPFGGPDIAWMTDNFLKLSLAGEHMDRELAAIYLALRPNEAANSQKLFGETIAPARLPAGHWSFNYGCFGIHRWGNRMATLKGYNNAVWSSEIYTSNNRYGRYQSYGGIQIMTQGETAKNGFSEAGWDWNRMPGATTIHLPLEILESPTSSTLMLKSPKRFCGSSNLGNRYGIFVMQLWEPRMQRFDPAFGGLKTAFCFDDHIICLGSGITAGDVRHHVETTLYQHALSSKDQPVWCNQAKPLTAFPAEQRMASPCWLLDGYGNAYIVRKGGLVRCSRQHQHSFKNRTKKPTEGDFAAAWIDHGATPRDAAYEYAILLGAAPEKAAAWAANPPYRVLRHDAAAHVVRDAASNVTGYVIFQSGKTAVGDILEVSNPCMIMMRPNAEGLRVSIGDPDLNITTREGKCQPKRHQVVVKGVWHVKSASPEVSARTQGSNTVLEADCKDGQPLEFELVK